MVHAVLICSEEECTAVFEAYGRLTELEALACDCGCGLSIVGWPDPVAAAEDGPGVELELIAA
jgi:hypothetical protein